MGTALVRRTFWDQFLTEEEGSPLVTLLASEWLVAYDVATGCGLAVHRAAQGERFGGYAFAVPFVPTGDDSTVWWYGARVPEELRADVRRWVLPLVPR
jgi:hypothetical protein